jgi:hypothetical protein
VKKGDKVKVIKLSQEKMPNMWGTPIDLRPLLEEMGEIEVAYTDGTYGIKFDDDNAYLIRRCTGVLFREDELEVVS